MAGYCQVTGRDGRVWCTVMDNEAACKDYGVEENLTVFWRGNSPCPAYGFYGTPYQYIAPVYKSPIPNAFLDQYGRIIINCTPPCYVVCEQVDGQHICWCEC